MASKTAKQCCLEMIYCCTAVTRTLNSSSKFSFFAPGTGLPSTYQCVPRTAQHSTARRGQREGTENDAAKQVEDATEIKGDRADGNGDNMVEINSNSQHATNKSTQNKTEG